MATRKKIPLIPSDASLAITAAKTLTVPLDANVSGTNTGDNSANSSSQPLDADLTAIAALGFTSTAFLKKTAADTWALDTTVLGTIATQAANAVSISGGTITGITDLVVADGGTGASTLTGILIGAGTTAITALALTANQSIRMNAGGTAYEGFTPGTGTVTSVSVVSANGFAGTVATATTTPAITISTSITGILLGDGTAVTGLSSSGTGNVVRVAGATLTTPTLGVASATSLATSAATPLLLTNGQLVNIALTSQTVGATTLTIPNFASVVDTFVFTTLAQTLSNKTFVAPALGTPSSGTGTNITGIPAANILAGSFGAGAYVISTSLQAATIELGAATDTTLSRVSAGVVAIEGVNILTTAGGTLTGKITLGEGADPATIGIVIDSSMSADERYSGITVPGTAGATLAFGDLCYLDVTATEWLLADASAATTAGNVVLGICVDASTDGAATSMLLIGTVRSAAFPASIALGAPVYISETAGDVTATAPVTTDSVMRRVGFAVTVEPNTIYFNPSNDYVTHV